MKKYIIIVVIVLLLGTMPTPINKVDISKNDYMTGNQMNDAKDVIVKSFFDNNDLDINRIDANTEDDFIKYVKGICKEIEKVVSKDTISKDDKEVLKKTFVDFADFIFYGKEIKGYKFKDLSLTSKKEALSLFKKIDTKFEDIYPNYKDNLMSISKNNYNNIKDKASKMLDNYKEQVKTETYKSCKKESQSILSKINKVINNWLKKVSG